MTGAGEELEVGIELDRALRSVVTGFAQIVERGARSSQDRSRDQAARAREDWLAERDAARSRYAPWTSPDRLERLDQFAAAEKWSVAAAWAGMDPQARLAEVQLREHIVATYGEAPAVLLQRTDPALLGSDPTPAVRLLSTNEAYGLAVAHAPSWYEIPREVRPLEIDRPPAGAVEEAFHSDWQHYSEQGVLPERSQREQWAGHVGRSEEFAPGRWTGPDGAVDHAARDSALAQVWAEGSDDRALLEISQHEAALHEAGMKPLSEHVARRGGGEEPWGPLLDAARFDAASADEVAAAWRDAAAAGLAGSAAGKQSAERLAAMMRERRGLDPNDYAIAALAERAANNTEGRRAAEDELRKAGEAQRADGPSSAAPGGGAGSPGATPAAPDQVSRQRVLELNEAAAEFYAANLRPGTEGHRYLADRLGDGFEGGPWTLGYARPGWQSLSNHLRGQGVTDHELVAAGLAEPGKFGVRDVFRDRVMMGVHDHETGELVGFVGRDLSGDERAPKVRNTCETEAFRKGDHVFGLHEAQPGARLVRVEGPFDAMAVSLASEGKAAGVAPMGTQLTRMQADAIADRANGRVWLANDVDEAGFAATERDLYAFAERDVETRHLDVPGSDPAEAWQRRPALMRSAVDEEQLATSRSAAEGLSDRYLSSPGATQQGYTDLVSRVSPHVSDPVERDLLAARSQELEAASARRRAAETSESVRRADHGDAVGQAEQREERRRGRAAESGADEEGGEASGTTPDEQERRRDEARVAATAADVDAARDETDSARAAERGAAYDRSEEADRAQMSPAAGEARNGSAHGFSRPTREQIESPRGKAVAAKSKRSPRAGAQGRSRGR